MPGTQPPIYRPPNRRQAKQPQPHPRATARVPTPHHATPALTKTTKKDELFRVFVRAGVVRTRGGDPCGRPCHDPCPRSLPLRSPWGGALPTRTTRSLDAYWAWTFPTLGLNHTLHTKQRLFLCSTLSLSS